MKIAKAITRKASLSSWRPADALACLRPGVRKTEDILLRRHLAEMERRRARILELGAFITPIFIESKTNRGILHSTIDRRRKLATHTWYKELK
jgi:hypothetical protein